MLLTPAPEKIQTGDFLAGYRTALGVRQADVAAALGWSRARVHELEHALGPTNAIVRRYFDAVDRLSRRTASQ